MRTHLHRRSVLAMIIALTLVATACGDDEPAATTATTTAATTATTAAASTTAATAATTATTAAATTTAATAATTATTAAATTATTSAAPMAVGPGVTDDQIFIGIPVTSDAGEGATLALGFNLGIGDRQAAAQAVVDYLNERGGIKGREIVPVYFVYDFENAVNAELRDAESQAACTLWTEDTPVFAAYAQIEQAELAISCLAGRGTPVIDHSNYVDDTLFAEIGDFYYAPGAPAGLQLDRQAQVYVDGLVAQGFLTADSVVGIFFLEEPKFSRTLEGVLLPALASHGITVAETSGISGIEANFTNIAVQFREAGVTHVLSYGSGATQTATFMGAAAEQGFFPKYGLHSDHILAFIQEILPAALLSGSVAVGWFPIYDVGAAQDPGGPTDATTTCMEIMEGAGQWFGKSLGWLWQTGYCDALFFIAAAAEKADELTPAGFQRGAEALGSDFQAASTFQTFFGPGRHSGVDAVRLIAYQDDCGCFAYVSDVIRVDDVGG